MLPGPRPSRPFSGTLCTGWPAHRSRHGFRVAGLFVPAARTPLPSGGLPISDGGGRRFDLTLLAREAGADYARLAPVIIGIGVVFLASWGFLTLGYVQSAYSYTPSFVVLTFVLAGVGVAWLGLLIRHNLAPVAIVIGPSSVRLDFEKRESWKIGWGNPKLDFVIADQRSAEEPQLPDLSAFGARFRGAPFVPGQYFPLTPESFEALLDHARELGLPIQSHELMIASGRVRILFSKGTVAYRIHAKSS